MCTALPKRYSNVHWSAAKEQASIPKEILEESIGKTARSVEILGPMADFLAVIDNNSSVPKLDRFEDRSHSFRAISLRFRQQFEGKEMMEFPSRLSRMKLLSVNMKNFVSGESMVEKALKSLQVFLLTCSKSTREPSSS